MVLAFIEIYCLKVFSSKMVTDLSLERATSFGAVYLSTLLSDDTSESSLVDSRALQVSKILVKFVFVRTQDILQNLEGLKKEMKLF